LSPASPVPEEKREGRKGLAVDVGSWWKALDFVGQRAAAARGRLVRLGDDRRALEAERARLRAEIGKLDQGGFSRRTVEVIAVVEARGVAPVDLQLEYFVPGAQWKPAYDLHYASARGQVRLEAAAVVEQATGEDWEQAELFFSTAVPGRGIDLPELLTWTLGERSEFVPRLRPREPLRAEPLLPFPAAPASEAVRERAAAAEVVRERVARALHPPPKNDKNARLARDESKEDAEERRRIKKLVFEDMLAAGLESNAASARPSHLSPGSPSSEEEAPRREREALRQHVYLGQVDKSSRGLEREVAQEADEGDERDELPLSSRIARFFKGKSKSAPAAGEASALASAPAKRETYTTLALALRDATEPRPAPKLGDPYLPAVSGGGLDYVYRAPVPASIPSAGKEIRIPLTVQTFRAAAFYEATPALAATAFLRARVRNDGTRPLLRGPVAIFGDGELVGVGELRTTGPSGDIELPLGADQDIRLVRQVVPTTKTTGLLIKSDETTYDVRIQVGNYKKQAVTIEVIDQVPKSRKDQVEVQLLATNPAPRGSPDVDGTARFRLEIPAGATRTVELRYKIVRPKDWILYQR
jgi:hypothetical protein